MKIPALRLTHLGLTPHRFKTVAETVSALGAVQAQDYDGAKWSLGLRVPGSTVMDIERAVTERQIVRTWPMRGTLHFVPPADIRWMLALMTPKVISGAAARRRELELDESILKRAAKLFEQALTKAKILTREQMLDLLAQNGISPQGQRGYHVLAHWAQAGLICFGPPAGKQQTFVLLEDWLPPGRTLSGDEALAEIALRYFTGHGPATVQDLARWTGLSLGQARKGLAQVSDQLEAVDFQGQSYWLDPQRKALAGKLPLLLLPGFDEYILGYKDRQAVLEPEHAPKICPGNNGMFTPTIVSDGQVVGTWKRKLKSKSADISLSPFAPLTKAQTEQVKLAAEVYGRYLGLEARLV